MKRHAIVRNARTLREVEAYLPANYTVVHSFREPIEGGGTERIAFVIAGHDDAGWSLDGYVIPRLASGLIFAEEIDPAKLVKGGATFASAGQEQN